MIDESNVHDDAGTGDGDTVGAARGSRGTARRGRAKAERISIPSAPAPRRALPPAPNVLRELHQAMRGRYALAIVLGLLVGAAAAAVAWRQGQPEFQSSGLIRIAYAQVVVMDDTTRTARCPCSTRSWRRRSC